MKLRLQSKIIFIFLLFSAPFTVNAQQDSLAIDKKLASLSPEGKILFLDTLASKLSSTKPAVALSYIEMAQQVVEENDLQKFEGRLMSTMSVIHRKTGNVAKAESEAKSAVELNQAYHDTEGLYNAYLVSGNLAYMKGDYASAVGFFSKSHDIAVKLKNIFGQASCSNNIGNIYYAENEFSKALDAYSEARDVYAAAGNKLYAALALDNMANCYQAMKMMEESKKLHLQALGEVQLYGDANSIVETAINVGAFFIDQKEYETGRKYLDMALQSARKNQFLFGEIIALLNISEVYKNTGEYDKAIEFAKEGALLAEKSGMNDYALNAYEQLGQISELQNNPVEALMYYKKYTALRDTLYSSEKQQLLADMSVKYETAKKDDEISNLTIEKEHKQQQLLYLSGGIILLVLFSLMLVRFNAARKKANKMLASQNKVIAEKNKDITDSITYALRIQKSVLPDEKILQQEVEDYFIFNRPRDIVSGDFYWMARRNDFLYVAVADCTGHGVPGALVSVVGLNMLNKAIEQSGNNSPSEILEALHKLVIAALNKDLGLRDSNDGMDVGLLCIDKKSGKAIFSGAGRPLLYRDDKGVQVIKGDRYSIAGVKKDSDAPFLQHEIKFSGNTVFYLSSDGFVDQFGEQTGKKYLSKRFQNFLQSISSLPMKEQLAKIENEFLGWKGNLEQVDDVMVVGIRV